MKNSTLTLLSLVGLRIPSATRAILVLLAFTIAGFGQHDKMTMGNPESSVVEKGLGSVDHKVSTKTPEAQRYFNLGLANIYAFNHAEAIKAFKQAAVLDPDLAMAYWGTALALGSNYNLEADSAQLKEAYSNLQKAVELAPKSSAKDQDYVKALSQRYATDPDKVDRKALAAAYRTAMGDLSKKYPDDLDAATLYAESMMVLRPWQLWTLDGKPAEDTLEIIAVLESVLKRDPNHSGANHYYIHAVEASPNPERGLESAKRIGLIAPNAGHLVHMPSHIYIRVGEYANAAKVNADAVAVDREYIKRNGAGGVYPMMYYNHNIHFLASSNAMNGNYKEAIKWARELESNVKPMLEMMPMLEMFAAYPMVTMVRFGKWNEILREPEYTGTGTAAAIWHFGRGMALAETGKPDAAALELAALRGIENAFPEDAMIGNNPAKNVMKVAAELLAGNIARSHMDKAGAITALKGAVAAEDLVNYDEPPDWDLPSREWLGRALLSDGQFSAAEAVYRAELAKHPKNGRALFGLIEALKKQGKDAGSFSKDLQASWANADTKLVANDLYH